MPDSSHPAAKRTALPAAVRRSLHNVFGIDHLREGQLEVIGRALAGEDTLAIMPTGAGKSLCYQLPALHCEGITVVVSPLISLMKDQADKLGEVGVVAEQLNSAQPQREQDASMERLGDASSPVVFATPERLTDPEFIEALKSQRVALFVVDEAHCISQWGHDFRPAFLEIGTALQTLGQPPLLALTATATADVIEDIRHQLGRPRMPVVNTGMYRSNLRLQVVQATSEEEKLERLLEALGRAQGAGIVYTSTVKACTDVYEHLLAAGHQVACYHGRLPTAERRVNQDRFMDGQARVMIATNAFGMGIDKPDIRFVLHYQVPGTLESYYQEAGRAGRDGETADCGLLFYRKDRQVQQFFLSRRYPSAEDLAQVHGALHAAVEGAPMSVADMRVALPELSRSRIAVALKLLRDGGLARSDRQRRWRAPPDRKGDAKVLAELATTYEEKAERDRAGLERMVFYAQTGFCRWRVLLEHFDEDLPFEERCGHCDNCLRAASEPEPAPQEAGSAELEMPRARFEIGDPVRVPRYGSGQVTKVAGEEITVVFPDASLRTFVSDYVESPASSSA